MADIVSKEKRSQMMSCIKGKNTKPELIIRRALFAAGFRYRLHDAKLAGRPDLVFPKYKTALFINGCFWHGHHCSLFRIPASNSEFWADKIYRNQENDHRNRNLLISAGWKVVTIWECSIRGKQRLKLDELITILSSFIKGINGESVLDIQHK